MRKTSMGLNLTSLRRSGARLMRLTTRLLADVAKASAPAKAPRVKTTKPKAPKSGNSATRPRARNPAPAFSPNPGGLVMHAHVPSGLRAGAPLVVLLHGCGQDPLAFAAETGWKRLADRHGFALLMPGQTEDNNRQRCFNWFRPGDIGRDLGESGSIHAMIEAMLTRHRCDRARVFVTGLSAGGAMTAGLLAAYPDVFAGGAVVAGLPAGAASGVVGAMTRMAGHGADLSAHDWMARARALAPIGHAGTQPWPRLSIWCGTADTVVAPVNATQLATQWTTLCDIDTDPVTEAVKPGVTRSRWSRPGEPAAVELWTLAGVGHVYPAATEAVPAAVEIARFWNIAA